jgi:predicted negative regulator of RcsB-dependent stress response
MTPWVITALILINAVLLALCGVLGWLWRGERKTAEAQERTIRAQAPVIDQLNRMIAEIRGDAGWLRPARPEPRG